MAEQPGEDILFLDDGLAISSGSVGVGQDVVLYGPDIARGGSSPAVEDDALLIQEGIAQTGPGTTAEITISDSQGSETGTITLTARSKTVEEYCNFDNSGDYSAMIGDISDEMLEIGVTSFLVYENTNTGDRSLGFVHDRYVDGETSQGGRVSMDIDGLPDSAEYVVLDDDPAQGGNDSYTLNPPSGSADHQWSDPNTDGVMIGKFNAQELEGNTITFTVTSKGSDGDGDSPDTVRFIGDEGTTVSRPYDGTNTVVEITF